MHTGDTGLTSAGSYGTLSKDSIRIEAIGELDELSCRLGHARLAVVDGDSAKSLEELQGALHEIGALLAGYAADIGLDAALAGIEARVEELEATTPIPGFVLPASTEASARLDLARTGARRLERVLTALGRAQPLPAGLLAWINRLSTLLFYLARREEGSAMRPIKRGHR